MLRTIQNIWKVEDLRKRILFTLFILLIYRIGAFVPVPNINKEALQQADELGTDLFGMLNTFSGGALFQFSIFALGIMPYITASIIVQLLSMDVIPKFAEWNKEGEIGKRKLAQVTRYGTVILGLIQSFATTIGFNRMFNVPMIVDPSAATIIMITIVLTAGTSFLMWLGEQVNEKGIGNGISILMFAAIVASIPQHVRTIFESEFINADALFMSIVKLVVILIVIVLIVAGVIYVQQGVRKVPVQYAKRVVGQKMYGGQTTHIPLKVNGAGVIPVIFASSLLMFPITIANFWSDRYWAQWISSNLNFDRPLGMVFYVLLIIGFTFFYTFVQFNPQQMADNMKKNGGYIPGIRPGKPTQGFLMKLLTRLTLTGSIFLAVVSVLPVFFAAAANLPRTVGFGGTSLLIVTGVALETMKQIESQLIKRHYKGFINK